MNNHKLIKILSLILILFSAGTGIIFAATKVSEKRQQLITYSLKFKGTPYKYGGTSPETGFDCSGYVSYVALHGIGKNLPRTAQAIYNAVTIISPKEREPGDLIFFRAVPGGKITHVGIYLGKRKFIHCASDGPHTGVIISTLDEKYWKTHYAGTGRFLPTTAQANAAK